MNKNQICVTIPVYKEIPDMDEQKSFRQVLKILYGYTIILFAPKSLNINFYSRISSSINKNIIIERFDDHFFKNIDGYNSLMMNKFFFRRFLNYKFMLIYQLDAFVFKDELFDWCVKDYQYIGAPLIEDQNDNNIKFKEISGNGGFSLRDIHAHYNVLTSKKKIYNFSKLLNDYWINFNLIQFIIRSPMLFARAFLGYNNDINYLISDIGKNEDGFWFDVVPKYFSQFKVAPFKEARYFAFEKEPQYLYMLNKNQLPFGCHAYKKYDPTFWSVFIE
jgi:hypothetical protein